MLVLVSGRSSPHFTTLVGLFTQKIARKEKSTFQKTKYLSDKRKNPDV